MSKKTKAEQEVHSEVFATIMHHHDGVLVGLGTDGVLYRYQYPRNSVFSQWTEGMVVRVYYSKTQSELAIAVHTMEESEP